MYESCLLSLLCGIPKFSTQITTHNNIKSHYDRRSQSSDSVNGDGEGYFWKCTSANGGGKEISKAKMS